MYFYLQFTSFRSFSDGTTVIMKGALLFQADTCRYLFPSSLYRSPQNLYPYLVVNPSYVCGAGELPATPPFVCVGDDRNVLRGCTLFCRSCTAASNCVRLNLDALRFVFSTRVVSYVRLSIDGDTNADGDLSASDWYGFGTWKGKLIN